jgi:shikimate 5-dehydrogenase
VLIVTLPASERHAPSAFAARALAAGADVLEVRGDLTPGLAPFESALPLLLAPRGGDLRALAARGAAWLDLEEHEAPQDAGAARRITSFHDHVGTPTFEELVARGERAFARGADLVKIACTARSHADVERLARVRSALARRGPTTVHTMGPYAEFDRVRSPWVDASTYAALDAAGASAPGQIEVARHRALAGPTAPPIFGVFGGPAFTSRSASPRLFDELFRRRGVRAAYVRLPSEDAALDLASLRTLGLCGLSVTAPHKLAAASFADALSPDAARAGAVNTLVFGERVEGHQFDSVGIERGHPELARRTGTVAIVGSGGVVPAVLLACERLGLARPTVFARNAAAARALAERFGVHTAPLADLERASPSLLVWTLPVDPDDVALPRAPAGAIALDLRYGGPWAFAARAAARGFTPLDGARMLVHQMLAQFELFTGLAARPGDAEQLVAVLAAR